MTIPRFFPALVLVVTLSQGLHAQTSIHFGGDATPSAAPYGALFTTLGPGHPTNGYFIGTTWNSDGDVLTMTTVHPNDYVGATSLGIWFGRGDSYGDAPGFNFAPTAAGNQVDVRLALAPASSEWSLYWYDLNGYGAALYFQSNGVTFHTQAGATFVPIAEMTAFHTYATHVRNGIVSYFIDGVRVGEGNANTGLSNFLLIGDGSATDISGFGSLRIDSLDITTHSGAAAIPEPASVAGWMAAAAAGVALLRRRASRS